MSQSIVCNNPCEDTKFSTDIKDEPLDAPSVTNIDNIKPDSPCSTITDEIDIKEPLYAPSITNIDNIKPDSSCSTIKDDIDIKEEPLDAPSITNIDNIKPASPCSTIKDEIYIKEEPLERIDKFGLNVEVRSSDPLRSNSSNLKVCGIHYFLVFHCLR